MRKEGKRLLSVFLSICMVFGLMTGMPVYATESGEGEEGDVKTGLLVTQDIDFENACVGQDPNYEKEMTASVKACPLYHFMYKADAESDGTTVISDNLSVTMNGEDAVAAGKVEIQAMDQNGDLTEICFKELGEYTVTYGGADENNTVTFRVEYPRLGFYSGSEKSVDGVLNEFVYSATDNKTFYMLTNDDENFSISDNTIEFGLRTDEGNVTDSETLARYFTTEPVQGVAKAYKISVVTDEDFGMYVSATIATPEGAAWTEEADVNVSFSQKKEGLVTTAWIDWNDEGVPGGVNEGATLEKEEWASPMQKQCFFFAYKTSEEDTNPQTVTADDLSITYNGAEAGDKVVCEACTDNTDFTYITFKELGDYVITYTGEGQKDKNVTIHVGWQYVAFYTTDTKTTEGILDGSFEYSDDTEDATTFYLILYSDNEGESISLKTAPFKITDYESGQEYTEAADVANYITYSEVSTGVYKIHVESMQPFGIEAYAETTDSEGNTNDVSCYIGVEYVQKTEGLVAKDWIDWGENGPYVNDEAEFTKKLWDSPCGEKLVYLAYLESENDENPTTVSANEIIVTYGGAPAGDKVVVKTCEENDELISFSFKELGDYTISYTGDGQKNKKVKVHVYWPEIGFYTSSTMSTDSILNGRFEYNDPEDTDAKSFYMILNTEDSHASISLKETPFEINDYEKQESYTSEEKVAEYISYNEVSGHPGVYKITVLTQQSFSLTAYGHVTVNPEDGWDTQGSVEVEYVQKKEGLVARWLMWSEENGFEIDPDEPYTKNLDLDLGGITLYMAYLESEEDTTPETLTPSDLTVTYGNTTISDLTTQNAYVNCSLNEQTDYIDFTFKKTGEYTFTYPAGTVSKTLKINVNYPSAALYKTAEMTDEGYISYEDNYVYSGNANACYLIFNDNVTSVSNVTARVMDCFSDAAVLTTVEAGKIYKITFSKEASDFNLIVSADMSFDWGEEPYEQSLNVIYEDFESEGTYTDGEAYLGYAGCYITEEEFENNTVYYNSSKSLFWVHADTVQGVIDKLSKVANGEEVLYKEVVSASTGNVVPDTDETTEGMAITNTGYIHVVVSRHGNEEMQAQYVASSGNMKGIAFEAGQDHFYTVHPKENGVYIEDAVYDLDLYRSYLENDRGFDEGAINNEMLPSALVNETYVSYYKGDFYKVTNTSNGTSEYFTLGEKIDYDSDKEDAQREWLVKMTNGDTTSDDGAFRHYMEPGKFPEMHVNVYCDMRFAGRYEKLLIGFKEGYDYTATLVKENNGEYQEQSFTRDSLGGAETKSEDVTITYWDGNINHDEDITFWLYDINSETTTSGTYEGDVDVAETPEPNAMPELTKDQKDAIEQSKKLTVDMQVDRKTEAQIDEDVVDAIKNAVKGDKIDGSFYVDIKVSASVDGVDGSTSITELKADMDVTIGIPDNFQKKNRLFRVVRHHEKDGKQETGYIESKMSADGKKITFKTDKFSTYAIVYEEGHVHTSSDWVVVRAATEKEAGLKVKKCTGCGITLEEAQIAKLAHTHKAGEWVVTREATGKAAGLKEQKCSGCGATLKTEVIPKFTVKLNAKKVDLQIKKSSTGLQATVMEGDAVKNWSSSNKKIVTVNKNGKITGKKAGTAVITVTTKKGATAKVTVTVKKKVVKCTNLKADKKSLTLKKGKSYQLKVTKTPVTTLEKVTYKSSNKKVATVNGKGKITAKKAGNATITVKCGNKTVKVKVKVKNK